MAGRPPLDASLEEGRTPRRIITMPDGTWDQVKALAAIRGMTASHLVRVFTDAGLAQARSTGELRIRRAKSAKKVAG